MIEKTDSLPSWLVHKEPIWLCEIKEEIDNSKEKVNDYIPKPFPNHGFEPLGWNDTLATIDVCANIHATQHCVEEVYDIISINMIKIIQEDEEMGTDSSHCNDELIFEGPKMELSKAMPIIQEDTMPNVPLMPVNMEITSIEDFKVHEDNQPESDGDKELTEEYYDAYDEFSS